MMKSIVAVDLDGTLVTCRQRHVAVARSVLQKMGLEIDLQTFWKLKRSGLTTREALIACGLSRDPACDAAGRWVAQIELPVWLREDKRQPDALTALSSLRRHGHQVLVLTARREAQHVVSQLEALELAALIDQLEVVSPTRAVAEKAALLEKTRPARYVGDTETDWAAARAAGVSFVAVTTGMRSHAALSAVGVDQCETSLMDALEGLLPRPESSEGRSHRS